MATQETASHAPGDCPDKLYGEDCPGIATYRTNPYATDMFDDYTRTWLCDGVAYGNAQSI